MNRKDFQASNSSDQWSPEWTDSNYTSANVVYDLYDTKYRGILLIKEVGQDRLLSHDYYDFHGNHFSGLKYQETIHYTKLYQNGFSFSIPEVQLDYEIIQYFTNETKQLVREINVLQAQREYNPSEGIYNYRSYYFETESENDGIRSQVKRLYNFTDILIIGSYLSSENKIICFFRIEDDIKYCTIDECTKGEYKTLINCDKTKVVVNPNIWYLLSIAVVTIVVFVIIAAIVIYLIKRSTKKTGKYELQSASTVNTINSETGQFVDPSKPKRPSTKERMGGQSRKSVSTQKLQKASSPAKGKLKMKPKKSPQLKK